ncbi:TetR family transcriptional regulator [Krasilnikovia cinnamomea]|uniref:TetR family transcriptional regulator n=1 Tax=Krasilnikovia cinnamomea TaxID=349313 RepID=A0A4Q7ZTF9_9ACTN|nr:TetR/AcrR family transcriptional regulator [Krasilnikovia cinnamomea]RZU54204.1 TetR family transcriptional regulator [Krasilnikovia cinnamomea]
MPRPRVHAPDALLDAAEELIVERGRASLTVRALAERAGASNGSIYHTFGSLETVVGAAWQRRGREFLAMQRGAVDEVLAAGPRRAPAGQSLPEGGRRAVLAAADAPARFADQQPRAARLLVTLRRDDVLTDAVAPAVADRLRALDAALVDTLRLLALAVWGRGDGAAVDAVTTCVVRLPGAMLFPEIRAGRVRPHTRAQLAAAVGAVLDCGPPPRPQP